MNNSKHAKWGKQFAALPGESSGPLPFSIPDQKKGKRLTFRLRRGVFSERAVIPV